MRDSFDPGSVGIFGEQAVHVGEECASFDVATVVAKATAKFIAARNCHASAVADTAAQLPRRVVVGQDRE